MSSEMRSSRENEGADRAPTLQPLDQQSVWRLGEGGLRILVIDNYDSFTYNLVQYLVRFDVALEVVRNDHFELSALEDHLENDVDAVVLSPGPGRPEDAGVCVDFLQRELDVPTFGVCLGHQALGLAHGATVDLAPTLMHGKTSDVRWDEEAQHPLFSGLANPFTATRYHSLRVREETLPEVLQPLAWSEDGVLQAMVHRRLPHWGVQFHPESILTDAGPRLLGNFVDFAAQRTGIELAVSAVDVLSRPDSDANTGGH